MIRIDYDVGISNRITTHEIPIRLGRATDRGVDRATDRGVIGAIDRGIVELLIAAS